MAGNTLALRVDVDAKNVGALDNIGGKLAHGTTQLAKFAAGAAAAGAAFGYFAAGFASDLNESLSKVGVVFGDNADEIEAWSETAAEAMGLSQQAALEAAGTFGNLFSAMDIGAGPTKDMSKGLVELAADLASFNNMDPTEVLEKLRAGVSGEAEPLRALGVNISAARTEAKALELGLWDGIGAISASAKAQANYALIMEDSTLAQGDFARTSDGMANQQRIAAATFQDTMAQIGQAFTPIIEMILPAVTAAFQSFGGWVTANMPTIKDVLARIAAGIGQAFTMVGEVFGFVVGVFVNNAPTINRVVSSVGTVIGNVGKFLTTDIFPPLMAVFRAVADWWTQNGPVVINIVKQVFGAISSAVTFVWPILKSLAEFLFPLIMRAAGDLFAVIDFAFKGIGGAVRVMADVIGWVFRNVITPVISGFATFFGGVGDTIGRIVSTARAVFQGLGDAVARIWGGITGAIRGAINGVIRIINGAIAGINRIQVHINVAGVKVDWNGLNLGMIPYLAHGGIVTGPTLAMIGEAGPEAVVPLDRGFGRAAPTIIINTGVGDPVAIGREVVEALQAYERHNGIGWQAAT